MKPQSFSRHLEEESPAYAKLKSNKFRKARFNKEEQAVMDGDAKAAIAGVALYIENDPELYDESYYKLFEEIKTQRRVEILHRQEFEVYYSFSGAIRGNRKYGNAHWSARFLYEFLCAAYNNGERFIDTYFNALFPYRPIYEQLENLVEGVQDAIETKWNNGELRGGQWASFYRFQESEMDYLGRSLGKFSKAIRDDIIQCLSVGLIPLRLSLSPATIKKRLELGLGTNPFYATSWLIHEIEVHVVLGTTGDGKLFYSDNYKGGN